MKLSLIIATVSAAVLAAPIASIIQPVRREGFGSDINLVVGGVPLAVVSLEEGEVDLELSSSKERRGDLLLDTGAEICATVELGVTEDRREVLPLEAEADVIIDESGATEISNDELNLELVNSEDRRGIFGVEGDVMIGDGEVTIELSDGELNLELSNSERRGFTQVGASAGIKDVNVEADLELGTTKERRGFTQIGAQVAGANVKVDVTGDTKVRREGEELEAEIEVSEGACEGEDCEEDLCEIDAELGSSNVGIEVTGRKRARRGILVC